MELKLRYKRKFYENAFETLKADGTYPPELMKAVLVSGGFGSNKLFNPEIFSAGYDLKLIEKGKSISNYSKDLSFLQKPSKELDDLDYLREKTEQIKSNLDTNYIDSRLGLILDCTKLSPFDVFKYGNDLIDLGYDILMIYISTNLSIEYKEFFPTEEYPEGDFYEYYHHEHKHYFEINYFFSSNTFNRDHLFHHHNFEDSEDIIDRRTKKYFYKKIKEFINNPIVNPLSKKWIDQQLDKYEPIV